MRLHQYLVLLLALPFVVLAADLPDPVITPGATNPSVTQDNIDDTICVKGYTKKIRPPQSFTNKLKKNQLRQYGFHDKNPSHYQEDHLIPLSIGGSPNDPENLWPQAKNTEWDSEKKDKLELRLHDLVCRGELPLEEARRTISRDWIRAYQKYVLGNLE
ncbi:MAG: hypothetical protein ACAH10_10890 [Methylophilaceae bacterium]